MVTITLKQVYGDGSGNLGSITFPASIVYGKDYEKKRIGQKTVRSLDGVLHTFDRGATVVLGELSIRGMLKEDKAILEDFLVNSLNFNEGYFTITPVTTEDSIDLGEGFGSPIGVCKLGEDFKSTQGLFTFKAPGVYSVRLPYTYTL